MSARGTEWNQIKHFETFYINVPMNGLGSHASSAILETRLVSAGKVGVNGAANLESFATKWQLFLKTPLPKKIIFITSLAFIVAQNQCIWTDTLIHQTSVKSGVGEVI